MQAFARLIEQKLFRAREALHFLFVRAADNAARRTFLDIYRNLGNRGRYDQRMQVNLRIGDTVVPCAMRLSDIFVLSEILFERQYDAKSPLPPNPVIVDAGGNVGLSGLWCHAMYRPAALHVFEPASENFDLLSKNLAALPGVVANRAAVGREAGTLSLNHGEFAGMHSLKPIPGARLGDSEAVAVVTLEDYMATHAIAGIDLLKIDVEGSELDVLEGLGPRLADVGVILGEVHEDMIDVAGFYRFLDRAGFQLVWKRRFMEGRDTGVHNFEARR